MMVDQRIKITFTHRQLGFIKKEAARLGVTSGEVVRQIIDKYIERRDEPK